MTSPGLPVFAGPVSDSTARLDSAGLLASARALRDAQRAQRGQAPLRGKYIAVLGEASAAEEDLLQAAVTALGARVTRVATRLSDTSSEKDVQDVAGMLGRLYDGVECHGLPPEVVQRLAHAVRVPLFEHLASPTHPTARLADLLGPEAAPGENRRCVLQAALIGAIG